VLVHGGGGTAFAEWAAKWREHGFCAIAMDLEGHLPERATPKTWKKHEWAGPEINGFYGDITKPIEDQWPYHAAADVLLAKALLKSFPEVDTNKIGITGFSWGGIHTATVIGIDTNWLFAIPIYHSGALFMTEHYRKLLGANIDLYKNIYDSLGRLPRVQFPMMWLTGLHDATFPLDAQRACYRAARGPCLISVQTEMKHGSFHAWNPEDSYVFAQSIVETGRPWIKLTEQGVEENVASAKYDSTKVIDRAEFIYTTDTGFSGKRKWIVEPVEPKGKAGTIKVSAKIPPETTAWYFNVYSGTLAVSSEYTETDMPQK
jgi:dienelactone hydrolase